MSTASGPAPRAIAITKVDTLGDLILFAPTLCALREQWTQTRIVVVIREAYADLAPSLAPNIDWLTTSLDPFANGPGADLTEVNRLRTAISTAQPDVLVAATSRHNWLETLIAATCGAARRVTAGTGAEDEFFTTQLKIEFGIDAAGVSWESVPIHADRPEWERNLDIAEVLLGQTAKRQRPILRIESTVSGEVTSFISGHDLQPRQYVVCAPAGFTNVALKTWPAERFAAVLRHVRDNHDLAILLIGHENERAYLSNLAEKIGGNIAIWAGQTGTLRDLAALIAGAALFVGNDTGAMHLAAALDVRVVAIFGGGTWPRFLPAARRAAVVVHPLPCFDCGWDCAFGDAPCVGEIAIDDVVAAVDSILQNSTIESVEIRRIERVPTMTQAVMAKASTRYRATRRDHLARQHKLEELTALDREKDAAIHEKEGEIAALKAVCNEREQSIFTLNGHVKNLQAHIGTLEANNAMWEKMLRELPPDQAKAARALADQAVHIRNIESLLTIRQQELAEAKASVANRDAGLHDLEQAKHYGQMLAEKERVIRELRRGCEEREAVIRELSAETTTPTAKARKLWTATCAWIREKVDRPLDRWLFNAIAGRYWMQIGILQHYDPRPLCWDARIPSPRLHAADLPQVAIVTPSYGQEKFIGQTLASVLGQRYPNLRYVVQDGGSKDRSVEIIAQHAAQFHHWESVPDKGQADAIGRGFAHVTESLRATDVMAWLNSDDLYAPGALRYVAEYFVRHPSIDVVYGHRIIIDDEDREIGRWIMPRHDPATLEWIDYVPQETLFWRKRAWDLVGGIDPSFQFALDWDLLARFQQAGCKVVRLPYFLGAFRVHPEQKTSQAIHTTGAEEMRRIRTRFHGEKHDDFETIERHARQARFCGAVTARLHAMGIRW